MPDRTTKVTLVAQISNYIANMELASKSTQKLGESAMATAEQQKAASAKIGTAFLAIGAVAAFGVALAVKEFADFDAKMAQLQTLSHANSADMQSLTTDALTAGQKIGFTANEVADAEIEMVKAGISVTDIMGGALPGALTLAAAGQIDVADSTEIATIAMTQFGLKGKDIPHVADLLAAGADKALGSVGDLGEALKSGGLVSAQFGISLDDTIGTLSAFANAGLIGETAGTDLRQMLLKLANPSDDSAKAMKNLGISVYDSAGHFVGLDGLAGQLHDKLGNLSEAQRNSTLATIFGSRAIAGANVLYKEGAKGIDDWNRKVNDQGFAAQQAAGKMDNLEGDLKKLEAAFQTSLIEGGSGANLTLRELTQATTGLVSGIGQLPQPLLQVGLGATAVVAVTSLLVGGFFKAVPAIASARASLTALGISSRAAAIGMGVTAIAVTGLISLLAAVAEENAEAAAKTDAYGETLDSITGKVTKNTRAQAAQYLAAKNITFGPLLQQFSAYDAADKLGISVKTVTDAVLGSKQALKELQPFMKVQTVGFSDNSAAAKAAGLSLEDYNKWITVLQDGVKNETGALKGSETQKKQEIEATKASTAANATNAGSLNTLGAAASDASGQISDLAQQITEQGKAELDMRSAQRDYQQAIDDASTSLKHNGATLDINTQKGRDNQASLDNIAKTATAASAAIVNQTGNQQDATTAIANGRAAYIRTAEAMGQTASQAQILADNDGLIPNTVTLQFKEKNLQQVAADVAALKKQLGILGDLETKNFLKAQVIGTDPRNGVLKNAGRAAGGIIPGPPSSHDNIYIPMATGEGVAKATAMLLPANRAALAYMNAGNDMANWGKSSGPMYLPSSPTHFAAQLAPAPQTQPSKSLEQHITFVNPVTQDPRQSASQAGQILASMAVVL